VSSVGGGAYRHVRNHAPDATPVDKSSPTMRATRGQHTAPHSTASLSVDCAGVTGGHANVDISLVLKGFRAFGASCGRTCGRTYFLEMLIFRWF